MEYRIHLVEYLGTTLADTTEGEVVVVTIRPDADSFRPHNIGLLKSQAERLLDDLQKALGRVAPLFLLVLVTAGCSARAEISTTNSSEESHTKVDIAVGKAPVAPLPVPQPSDPEEDPKAAEVSVITNFAMTHEEEPAQSGKNLEVIGSGNTVVNVTGDLSIRHYHTVIQIKERAERIEAAYEPVRVEARPRIDSRCERLLGEHLERVEGWKAMMKR